VFQDSQPFLRWARRKGLIVGLVSNAEYRYQEVILPSFGLSKAEWDFGVFSGIEGIEKPDPRIFTLALERAGNNIAPEEVLHIGDSMRKDYVPAKSIGMHALLVDRFKTEAAKDWIEAGAIVLPDLVAVQQLLESDKLKC
jgi:FMN phosphatase YigB (HAD superfamily)